MEVPARGGPPTGGAEGRLISLIGRAPDYDGDRERLRRIADGRHAEDVAEFCRELRTSELQRDMPLRELLHGLELVEPLSFWDFLDSRAVNLLRSSGLGSWTALCNASVCTIEELHRAGPSVVDSTVAGVTKEWAIAYLRRWGISGPWSNPAPTHGLFPDDPPADLPELSIAFERLEAQPGFDAFATRLMPKGRRPTYRELAERSGRSKQAVSAERSRVKRLLHKQMRDPEWPIAAAVHYIEERIGSLATPQEVDSLFSALHRDSGALGREKPHRRTLLLWLGGYLLSEEWVLSRDLDLITGVLLQTLVGRSSSDLDSVGVYLTKLGVREQLQLPWLASQYGYRILDGRLIPTDGA